MIMGEYVQLFWMVLLAVVLFYLLRRQAIKASRDKHTRRIIRQRLEAIRVNNESWRNAGKQEA